MILKKILSNIISKLFARKCPWCDTSIIMVKNILSKHVTVYQCPACKKNFTEEGVIKSTAFYILYAMICAVFFKKLMEIFDNTFTIVLAISFVLIGGLVVMIKTPKLVKSGK